MELISVIVPVYNTAKYIERCVGSIQKQTYTNLEIILVDDGSLDGSAELCDAMSKSDHRITVLHKANAGQGLARRDGLQVATGEYVTFVDSDDWISEEHIENLHKAIATAGADIAIGNHTWISVSGEQTIKMLSLEEGSYQGERLTNEILLPLIGADENSPTDVLINSSVSMNLYSMDVIKKNGIEFVSERFAVAEDFYFNLDFLHCATHAVFCLEAGYYYCQNIDSTCERYNPKRFERTLNYYELTSKRVEMYGLQDRVAHRVERSFLMKLRVAIRHIVMADLIQREKIFQIKSILTNTTVKEVLLKYPINAYSVSLRLLTKLMRSRCVLGVYYLMLLRERGRENGILKKLMRSIGLRR